MNPSQTEKSLDQEALLLASLIFRDVSRTIMGVQSIVTVLLQYALLGASITNDLIDLTVPSTSEGN